MTAYDEIVTRLQDSSQCVQAEADMAALSHVIARIDERLRTRQAEVARCGAEIQALEKQRPELVTAVQVRTWNVERVQGITDDLDAARGIALAALQAVADRHAQDDELVGMIRPVVESVRNLSMDTRVQSLVRNRDANIEELARVEGELQACQERCSQLQARIAADFEERRKLAPDSHVVL